MIAYRDNGIICVAGAGITIVDSDSVGIYVVDPSSGLRTHLFAYGFAPDCAPDGTRLVFEHGQDFLVADMVGNIVQQITPSQPGHFPDWSPDGSRIAFQSSSPRPSVWIMSADGVDQKRVVAYGKYPDWSPDGTTILFVGQDTAIANSPTGLFSFRLGDSTMTLLYAGSVDWLRHPAYSPDGSQIALGLRGDGACQTMQLWVMNANGTNARQLTSDSGAAPAWSPDGRSIVFVRANPLDAGEGSGVLWMIDLATSREYRLTNQRGGICP